MRLVMSVELDIMVLDIISDVEFVIFVLDGLWEYLFN